MNSRRGQEEKGMVCGVCDMPPYEESSWRARGPEERTRKDALYNMEDAH